ncbi:MAG TPA: ATP-binding protein [Candidatus Brocadiia bacterium]|nr:ATP-binding protein [Candidatus Brocadiia bacterium]
MSMFKHFGVDQDAFEYPEPFESADLASVRQAVQDAVARRGWLLVSGPPGAGKTFAVTTALEDAECRTIRILGGDRSETRASAIDAAIFEDVASHELPRRSREARRRQIERILGLAAAEQPLAIYCDEATWIRPGFLTEVKLMRDTLRFGADPRNPRRADRRPLFAVVMVGWPGMEQRVVNSSELKPRIRRYRMQGLAKNEISRFCDHLGFSKAALPPETRAALAQARWPLAVRDRLLDGMDRAWQRGSKVITPDDVAASLADLMRMASAFGVTLRQAARETGISVSTASTMVSGAYNITTARAEQNEAKLRGWLQDKIAEGRGDIAAAG